MKIMIDPGHRNNVHDYGAAGNGLKESAIALAISLKLKKDFEAAGHTAFLTRKSESETIGINQRPQEAKKYGCDWLISVHINAAANNKAKGVEVLYRTQKTMADAVCNAMAHATGMYNRGIKQRNDLGVLNGFDKSILIECGFINNPDEAKLLATDEFQSKISRAVVKGFNERLDFKVKKEDKTLYDAVKGLYGFDENTMEYLHAFKYKDALMQAFIDKRPISPATEEYVLGYKYGRAILSRVYG